MSVSSPMKFDVNSRIHPEYMRLKGHWDFLESTYRGGREWFSENIFPYLKEGEKAFVERVKRSYRFNHTREVVNLVTKYVFKGEIVRNENAPEPLKDFWKSATRRGESIDALMADASRKSSTYGQPYLVIDSTATPEIRTIGDQKKEKAQVYGYMVKPQHAKDMSFDERGELNWILLYESRRDDADFSVSKFTELDCYRLWTRTEWVLFETVRPRSGQTGRTTLREKDRGAHNLGIVPVIPVPEIESDDPYSAPGLIEDIAYLDRAVANYLSNLDAIIQDQTFSQLAIPAQNILPGDSEYNSVLEMGTKNVFIYDGETGTGPHYISPDPRQAGVILAVITKIITEIYHSVGMAGERTKMDNAAGIDNSSGVAKAYDFDRMNTMLKAKADRLQSVENKVARIVMAWNGVTDYDETPVTYPSEFDTRSLYDEFEIAERLSLLSAPPELRRHQLTQMIEKLYPQLARDIRAKIEADIKDWADPEKDLERQMELAAGLASAKASAPPPAKGESKQGQNNKDIKED